MIWGSIIVAIVLAVIAWNAVKVLRSPEEYEHWHPQERDDEDDGGTSYGTGDSLSSDPSDWNTSHHEAPHDEGSHGHHGGH